MELDAIREAVRRHPFLPFTLRLADGQEVLVKHPEFIAIPSTGRRVVVFAPGSADHSLIDPLLVVSIDYRSATTQDNSTG